MNWREEEMLTRENVPKVPGFGGCDLVVTHGDGKLYMGDQIDSEQGMLGVVRRAGEEIVIDELYMTAEEIPPTAVQKDLAKVKGYWIPLFDSLWPIETCKALLPKVQELAKKAAETIKAGKTVLVVCAMGRNRSGLLVGITLRELGYSGETAVKLVREARSENALNNYIFRKLVEKGTA